MCAQEGRLRERHLLIGVDCATKSHNVGLAMGWSDADGVVIDTVLQGTKDMDIAAQVAAWLLPEGQALLALDAPLGWPIAMGEALFAHEAGASLPDVTADRLFQRTTDRVVYETLQKRPLDVGADRIARTAHAALGLLGSLRQRCGCQLPLAWVPGLLAETSAIEVYPAATMAARGWSTKGYKAKDAIPRREEILAQVSEEMVIPTSLHDVIVKVDHTLDAVLCVLAAADFMGCRVLTPTETQATVARREGWIWCAHAAT